MLKSKASEIIEFLKRMPEIQSCKIEGSLSSENVDEFSDIDIQIDVSGVDNGIFLTKLPQLFANKYNVVYFDYAPSMAPEKYIVSIAIDKENPFRYIDIDCVATPNYQTISAEKLKMLNNMYDHTLKLFTANLKHYLRGKDCYDDICKMFRRLYDVEIGSEMKMLHAVFNWLKVNKKEYSVSYLEFFEKYL